ncbi:hypothetical protein B0T26DRAFT_756326 [Lasiosphaeria miniovina]|uniref:Uncharacterized protein n=1 Tax=Lasiosphaeria miniovina TaxID=1954250 RepID=A0AA40DP10_9PEZI|nr:uncharacterized protein B0T26DRAFT_756326 [Lasiosphaeria miniovina]KAK0706893.1 hypothetical protein B0T26DRAFT_756326 [Lasiosphaeria miniovina]
MELEEFELGLQIHGSPLVPWRASSEVLETYNADLVSPGLVLGMCYASPDAGNDSEPNNRSILFAPLAGSDTTRWFHTRLVLVVEILEDGSVRPLYFVSNVVDDDDDDDTKRHPPLDQNDGDIPAKFRVESTSKPQIVETGAVASHWKDTLPTALYPLNKAEEQM